MSDYLKPILRRNPDRVIIHVGTNNLHLDEPKTIRQKISGLVDEIRLTNPNTKIAVPSITSRIFKLSKQKKNITRQKSMKVQVTAREPGKS